VARTLRVVLVMLSVGLMLSSVAAGGEIIVKVSKPEAHRTLNPLDHFCLASFEQFSLVYEPLATLGPDGKIMPVLATSWTVSPDSMTLTLQLRKGVKFHNGEPFDAESVKFTFDTLKSHTDWVLNYWMAQLDKVEILNPYEVRITFTEPVALTFALNLQYFSMLPPKHTQETGGAFDVQIGTGPFKFVEWVKGVRYVVERNEDYWGWGTTATTNVDRFIFTPIIEATTRMAALKNGEVDLVSEVPPEYVPDFEADPGIQVGSALGFDQLYLGLETSHKPLDSVLVRKAIHYALNREALAKYVMKSGAVPLGCLPQGMFGSNPYLVPYEYNPEKARELLAEAGYPNGFKVKLIAPLTWYPKMRELTSAIAAQLAEVGITVTVHILDDLAFIDQRKSGQYDIYLTGGEHTSGHPNEYLTARIVNDIFHSSWHDEECIRLINEARAQPTAELQEQYYREVVSLMHERGPWVPIWRYEFIYAYRDRLTNVQLGGSRRYFFLQNLQAKE